MCVWLITPCLESPIFTTHTVAYVSMLVGLQECSAQCWYFSL